MVNRTRRTVALAAPLALALAGPLARAQSPTASWPDRPIRFVVPYPPGTPPDLLARWVAERLSKDLRQPVTVDNRAGAGGTIGTEQVARATPDGTTFLVTPSGTLTIAPFTQKTGYGLDDFVAVAELGLIAPVATVRPDAPFPDFRAFVAAAKAAPGRYTFASNGPGSATQLVGKMLHRQAGIDVVEVPYKGATESMTDLIGGRVDIMYAPITVPQIKAGRLKGLVTVADRRNAEIPDVPTLAEQGFDIGKVPGNWFGVLAPKGTAEPVVTALSDRIRRIVDTPEARQALQPLSIDVEFKGPREFATLVRDDAATMRGVIQAEGLQAR